MSGPSESDSSDRSGGESDREGSAASSNKSEIPDTVKRRCIQQQQQHNSFIEFNNKGR
jgi:hypothetical protein